MSFDDLLLELKGQKTIQEDPDHVPLKELFNAAFMRKHSSFDSFEEFAEKGNFHIESYEDIANIPDELYDRHVSRETDFADWKSMLDQANAEYKGK
ncbi:hypothetical protein [Paenibacillus chibensis]|uniref:hypothetical protein n=1 Tax=Paenibacillus chibensis TaxID=59846 RepID=UPI000FDA64BF|nr:hypothetical protein [Paenibacillus chibensis]MEC0373578.1 hypothetical protein [Paenibacillus chibensis]